MIGIDVLAGLLFLMVAALAIALPIGILWLVVKVLISVGWLVARVLGFAYRLVGGLLGRSFSFARGEVADLFSAVGSSLAGLVFVPLVVGNVALGRWSKVGHYGRALEDEIVSLGLSLYRVAIGHPTRLLGLSRITEGIERRLPQVVASSPGREVKEPRGRKGRRGKSPFPGYRVVSSLPRGGSGAHLFLAEPLPEQHDRLAGEGKVCPGRVVIKSFSLEEGSSLPQIVRESRALSSAKELGLVLDHVLEAERFYYAMPYVPGDDLAHVTRRLHDRSGPEGLRDGELVEAVGHAADILASLERFHLGGLWHKDIKPSNVIVSNDGHAYLVDLGLVTPLRSALTLTTHGTEYFRDPEMVRLAMQGVKVHEVDGVKFDLYSTGAVLFSMLENSFPAHGSLSQMTKRTPETVRWIVRRAMADLGSRYGSAREMLADLSAVAESADPFAMKVVDLPSVSGDTGRIERIAVASGARTAAFFGKAGANFGGKHANAPQPSPEPQPVASQPAATHPWPKGWPWKSSVASAASAAKSATSTARDAVRSAAARKRHKTRLGLGTLAALGFFAAVSVVPVAILMEHRDTSWGRTSMAFVGQKAQLVSEHANGPWKSRLQDLFADSREAWDSLLNCDERDKCRNTSRRCDLHPTAVDADFDVLVLNDLPRANEDDLLDALGGMLADEAYTVWGLSPAASAQAREIELIAAARKAAGLGGPGDDAAAKRLSDLVSQDEDLDAVLWLGQGDYAESSLYRLVTAGAGVSASSPVAVHF